MRTIHYVNSDGEISVHNTYDDIKSLKVHEMGRHSASAMRHVSSNTMVVHELPIHRVCNGDGMEFYIASSTLAEAKLILRILHRGMFGVYSSVSIPLMHGEHITDDHKEHLKEKLSRDIARQLLKLERFTFIERKHGTPPYHQSITITATL